MQVGDSILVVTGNNVTSGIPFTDSLGNVYADMTGNLRFFASIVQFPGTPTIAVTLGGGVPASISALEVTATRALTPIDQVVATFGTTTVALSPTTPFPTGTADFAVGLVSYVASSGVGPFNGQAFVPALPNTTIEAQQISGSTNGTGVTIFDAACFPAEAIAAEAFTAGAVLTWAACAVLFTGTGVANRGPIIVGSDLNPIRGIDL